ncbi:hypothetical protein [Streptomyces sp. NPDC001401]|uniref:hypothetical protein n=1 Tax=Streptomyces sp. NPDC001401 TaxID=3364570 RepID=UPI0036C75AAA
MNENAVTLRFADRATAYQALSDLKYLSPATTEVRAAVLIERLEDGAVRVPEGLDTEEGRTRRSADWSARWSASSADL